MAGPTVRVKGCTEAQIPSMVPRRDGRGADVRMRASLGMGKQRRVSRSPFVPDGIPLQ